MSVIYVRDRNEVLELSFQDVTKYHGSLALMAVAVGFRTLQAAFAELFGEEAPDRKELSILSGHAGPGFRDVFEYVTRAVTRGAYRVDVDYPVRAIRSASPAVVRVCHHCRRRTGCRSVALRQLFASGILRLLEKRPGASHDRAGRRSFRQTEAGFIQAGTGSAAGRAVGDQTNRLMERITNQECRRLFPC